MHSLIMLPYYSILFLILLTSNAIVFQTLSLVHGYFVLHYNFEHNYTTILDIAVLLKLLLAIYVLAKMIFNVNDNFFVVNDFIYMRYFIFGLIFVASIVVIHHQKDIFPTMIILNAGLTLPFVEELLEEHFAFTFTITMIFWLMRAINNLYIYVRKERNELSALSTKEALDTMDFGLLFCRADGLNDGQILLSNEKMQELMYSLIGYQMFNGKIFYHRLVTSDVLVGSTRQPIENQLVYTLPDNHTWNFKLEHIEINNIPCVLLVASDTTKIQKATMELYSQHHELEKRNQELNKMLNNLEELCKSEETLSAKARVHDLLGQRISLILRSVREHQKPDEKLLSSIANGLLEELKSDKPERDFSLGNLAQNFKALGIDVSIEGQLPNNERIKEVFYKIIAEAMTNSVRHGYASEISIIIENDKDMWALLIRDNGKPKNQVITEGGGLHQMRKLVKELGGEFAYETKPHFTILVKISERGRI